MVSIQHRLEVFEWANLTKVPLWDEVQKVQDLLIMKKLVKLLMFISSSQDMKVFDEFSLISKYVTDEKISDWNAENVFTENRPNGRIISALPCQ